MDSHAAADPPPATAEGADSASRTPEADVVAVVAADLDAEDVSDLHDCFGLMYAGSEWASDDEVGVGASEPAGIDRRGTDSRTRS